MKKKGAKTSIEKALDLIEALKNADDLGVTELSKILNLNKNNVFRLLATLEVKGLVEQDEETGHYKLGMRFLYLEDAYIKSLHFLNTAKPFMRKLRNQIGETVYVSVLHKNDVVYVYSEESNKSVHVHSKISQRYPAEITASGRALIKAESEDIFPVEVDIEETEPEVVEVATVIRDELNHPIAALSIVAPISRIDKARIESEIRQPLLNAAKNISEKLKEKSETYVL
ncbi:MAG: IclR family transcriptional regulator [Aquificota bacterium]|nr:MAG: IclR family transcriptional regulator [Aquificota bacterium]